MSLILDALRKADAERERGSVPSLHSHPVVPHAEEGPARTRSGTSWMWIAMGVSAGLLGAAAIWVMVGRDAPRVSPQGASAPVPSSPPAVAPAAPPPAAVAPAPPVATPPAAAAADASSVAQPAPWTPPDERKQAGPDTRSTQQVPVLGNVLPAEAQVYTREQLPPNIRAELPQFSVGGSIYSPVPAARSLIVNGQLFREKDRLNQDLTLEEIKLKAAVFSFRGYRFEVLF